MLAFNETSRWQFINNHAAHLNNGHTHYTYGNNYYPNDLRKHSLFISANFGH